MRKLVLSEHLRERIIELEERRNSELKDIKYQYHSLIENVKPSNLLKNSFSSVYNTSLDKKTILTGITSLVIGFFTKKLVVGDSNSSVKKMFGNIIQYSIPLIVNKFYNSEEEEVQ